MAEARRAPRPRLVAAAAVLGMAAALSSCSVRRTALKLVANALSGSGGTYASDEDPELVRDAIPFGLKTYEALLAELPDHEGLRLSLASGFTQYAYAFVQEEADRVDVVDAARARALRARARALFLRGRGHALAALEARHPGFGEALRADAAAALRVTRAEDAPFLYWAGASWAAALSAVKDDLDLVADLPTAAALVNRVLELDEAWGAGAAHDFFVSYEGGRSDAMGGSASRAREHYARALQLSRGRRASLHLSLAEGVSVASQDVAEFRRLLAAALAVDPAADPDSRLANVIARRRAEWLATRIPDLFLEADEVSP